MAFDSGRVTFTRFRVTGETPAQVDQTVLDTLHEHRFQQTEIGAPDEVEVGFTTGEHILDTQFSYEKNGFGACLLCAMRLDTHKVPSDLKQAYKKINEQAAAEGNPSGFASKAQKRDAAEQAEQQVREDLASGRFRRSKAVPVLWDLEQGMLYCGAGTNTAIEQLASLLRTAFNVELQMITAGTLASELLRGQGQGRDYEDLKPTPFTGPPQKARDAAEDGDGPRDMSVPQVPWIVQSVDLKDFLGNEFLLWLWWHLEQHEGTIEAHSPDGQQTAGRAMFLALDKALDMECAWGVGGKQSLRGDGPSRLREAGEALRMGKWPRKVGLLLSDGEHQWELTLQGDKMSVSGASMPEVPDAESPRELTEARLQLVRKLAAALDGMYSAFLAERVGSSWPGQRDAIGRWIRQRDARPDPSPEPAMQPNA
jgi:hypothetical protein